MVKNTGTDYRTVYLCCVHGNLPKTKTMYLLIQLNRDINLFRFHSIERYNFYFYTIAIFRVLRI